jgi:23S rRNA (uracil1939-C5)-methyltransferase
MKIKLTILDLASDGSGVGRREDKPVFVPGALPGEEVTVQILANKKTYMRGRVLAIEKKSRHRLPPACPWFGVCGGCRLQHAAYEAQLEFKRRQVADVIARIVPLDPPPELTVVPSPDPWGYRNKMIFPVRSRSGRTVLGFYKVRSHGFVPIEACPVTTEGISASIGAVNRSIGDMEPYDERTQTGVLRHVILRSFGDEPPQATFVLFQDAPVADLDSPSVWLNINPAPGNVIIGKRWKHVSGYRLQEIKIRETVHLLHPGSFFQANTDILEPLLSRLDEMADPSLPLLDLYGGSGFLGLQLAHRVPHVTVVEENPLAILSGRESLRANSLDNVEFVEGTTEAARDLFRESARSGFQLILDPPRKGLSAELISMILENRPERLLYLSCNPASFARDTALLKEAYHLERVALLDFFPQTAHVEVLGLLTRETGPLLEASD